MTSAIQIGDSLPDPSQYIDYTKYPLMQRMDAVAEIARDPVAIAQAHPEARDELGRSLMRGITAGSANRMVYSSVLMGLRVATADEVIAAGVPTMGVSEELFYINGPMCMSDDGLLQGDIQLWGAILDHEGFHQIVMDNIRLSKWLAARSKQGIIGPRGKMTASGAARLFNGPIDLVNDQTQASLQTQGGIAKDFLEQHHEYVKDMMRYFGACHCPDLDMDGDVIAALTAKKISAEAACDLILQALPPPPVIDVGGAGGQGQDESEGDGDDSEGQANGEGEGEGQPQQGEDNNRGDNASDTAEKIFEGHVQPTQSLDDATIQQAEAVQASNVVVAGKQAGTGSALYELCMKAQEVLAPNKIDWKDELALLVGSEQADLSYKHQYEVSLAEQQVTTADGAVVTSHTILPDYDTDNGVLAIGFDTSGSVWGDRAMRKALLIEAAALVRMMNFTTVYLLPCDTSVKTCIEITPGDAFPLEQIKGGGGTWMHPIITYIDEHDLEPDAYIYFTDGFLSEDTPVTDYPQYYVVGETGMTEVVEEWGKVIRMDDLSEQAKQLRE